MLEFWTLAQSHPRFRIVRSEPGAGQEVEGDPQLLVGDEFRGDYRLISLGNAAQPPEDLDLAAISTHLSAKWAGPSRRRVLENGLSEHGRDFSVVVQSGEPGRHSGEVAFSTKDRLLTKTLVGWTTSSLIQASPSGLILSSGRAKRSYSIRVMSTNQTKFLLKSVHTSLANVQVKIARNTLDQTHELAVEYTPGDAAGPNTGEIVVETDNPRQPLVKVGVYVPKPGGDDDEATSE